MGVTRKKSSMIKPSCIPQNTEMLDVFPHKTQHGNGKNTNTTSDLHTKVGGGGVGVNEVRVSESVRQWICPVWRGFLVNKQPH